MSILLIREAERLAANVIRINPPRTGKVVWIEVFQTCPSLNIITSVTQREKTLFRPSNDFFVETNYLQPGDLSTSVFAHFVLPIISS